MVIEYLGHVFVPEDEGYWLALEMLLNSGCPKCGGVNSYNCDLCRGRS